MSKENHEMLLRVVESMKIYTGGIPAEFGRKLGGIIEVTTNRNSSPGFHGILVLQGGSFGTASGFLSGQHVAARTTGTVGAEGFLADRYLDPPVQANFTNHGSNISFTGTVERDFTKSDRLRVLGGEFVASSRDGLMIQPSTATLPTIRSEIDR